MTTTESPFAVANFFIEKAADSKHGLTPMKLMKLVYIAHGWSLGLIDKPLIAEPPQAWKYGPVIESLYGAYRRFGSNQIPLDAVSPWAQLSSPDERIPLLRRVWDVYSPYSGGQLSTLTHEKGTPWYKVWVEQGGCNRRRAIIPDDLIREHYQHLAGRSPAV